MEDAVYLADETSLRKTQREGRREIVTQPAVHGTFVDTRSWQAGGVPEDTCAAHEPEIGLVVEGQYATDIR